MSQLFCLRHKRWQRERRFSLYPTVSRGWRIAASSVVFSMSYGHREQLSFLVGAKGMSEGYVRSFIEIRRSTAKVAILSVHSLFGASSTSSGMISRGWRRASRIKWCLATCQPITTSALSKPMPRTHFPPECASRANTSSTDPHSRASCRLRRCVAERKGFPRSALSAILA